MNILALDLGTTTGWAMATPTVISGTWSFASRRFEGGGMRYLRFRKQLMECHELNPLGTVYFEEVHRHLGTDAAHVYGGLLATLTAFCEEHKIPYSGVGVGTIKRHATGSGSADKAAMIAAAMTKGWRPADDNEADALHLLDLVVNGDPEALAAPKKKPRRTKAA